MNGRRNGTQKQGLRRRGCNEIDSRPDAIATLCDEIRYNDTERSRVSLTLFFSFACIHQAQYPRRESSPFFSFFFFYFQGPPQPISLIRRLPIYARYESTRGQAEESRWIMIETVALIRFRSLSLSLFCRLINRVLRDHALAL